MAQVAARSHGQSEYVYIKSSYVDYIPRQIVAAWSSRHLESDQFGHPGIPTRDADAYLETAQELGLIRDSLSDELSYLSGELVSAMSGPDRQPTLLEDLEALQRNLKELESVKSYVQVIHRALSLRCE